MKIKPLKILVVEDEFITQKTICNYLTEIGYEVVNTAMNAENAIEILKSTAIDLAILDINIKGSNNGIWLAEYISENFKIPFIFLTAYADSNTLENALHTNPMGYLVKPFQKLDLLTSIEIAVLNFKKNSTENKEHLLIKHNEIYTKVEFSSILYIESDKNYLIINCNTTTYRYRSTITDFENLMPNYFIKIHKGFIINCKKVNEFSNNFVVINNINIPISKTFKETTFNKLRTFC